MVRMNLRDGLAGEPLVQVHFPQALREKVGGQSRLQVGGRTVRDLIDALDARYPGFRFHVCYETGELRPFVNIFLNRENIRYLQVLETPLSDGAILHIFPSVAGGNHPLFNV